MADDTIRSFLVSLGFKVDESAWARFQSTIETATLKAALLSDAIEAAARSIATAVGRIAGDFEDLFYASSRLGASVESIRAFGYAVSQMGGTVAGAQSSLKAFGDWMRQTPGAEQFLHGLGVATRDAQGHAIDRGQMLLSVGERLAEMAKRGPAGQALASQYAGILGIDQETLLAIERQGTRGRYNESIGGAKAAGIGAEMAAASARFEQAMRETWNRIATFAEGAAGKVFAALAGPLEKLNVWLDEHKEEINAGLTKIATAVGEVADRWVKGLGDMKPGEIAKDFDELTSSLSNLVHWFAKLGDDLKTINDYLTPIVKMLNVLSGQTPIFGGQDAAPGEMFGHDWAAGGGIWGRVKRFFGVGASASEGPGGGNAGRGPYNVSAAYALIKKVGGTDEEARVLAAIAQPESQGNPNAHNPNAATGDDSYGLWQINMLGGMGPERRAKYGLKSNEDLYDPETNARIALRMHRESGGYGDWSTYRDGAYRKYLSNGPLGSSGGALPKATPLGSNGVGYNALGGLGPVGGGAPAAGGGDKHVSITHSPQITVNAPDPHTAAAAVGLHIDRSAADVYRNLQGAVA